MTAFLGDDQTSAIFAKWLFEAIEAVVKPRQKETLQSKVVGKRERGDTTSSPKRRAAQPGGARLLGAAMGEATDSVKRAKVERAHSKGFGERADRSLAEQRASRRGARQPAAEYDEYDDEEEEEEPSRRNGGGRSVLERLGNKPKKVIGKEALRQRSAAASSGPAGAAKHPGC